MSQRTSIIIQATSGVLGLVCLNLALTPSAFASPDCCGNGSNYTGGNSSNSSAFSNASGIAAQSLIVKNLLDTAGGSGPYGQQVIANAQAIQGNLATAAANYSAALAALAQAQAQAGSIGAAPVPVVDNTQRFSVRGATAAADCGCKNPDAAPVAGAPSDSGAKLAEARAAEVKAAAELVKAQEEARQFLAANKKPNQVSASATQFSPIW